MFERLKQILSKVDARIFPLLTAVVSLVILIVAKKPWQTTLAEWAEKGKRAPLAEYVTAGFWQGCVAALVISLLVVCTARWWMRGPGATGRVSLPPEAPLGRRKFMLVLAAGLLVIGLHRWQRMDVSLWGDESWSFNENLEGDWIPVEKGGSLLGEVKHKPASWRTTVFSDQFGGNHYLYSILSRLCLSTWQKSHGRAAWDFEEWIIRIPPFVAGLGALAALAIWLRRLGCPRMGLLAAALLALHPWHLRYSTEGRGYTLMLLFFILLLHALTNALERGKARYWVMVGVLEFLTMFSWKGAVYPLAILNAAVALWVLRSPSVSGGSRVVTIGRMVVSGLMAAVFFLPLTFPQQLQLKYAIPLLRNRNKGMGPEWLHNIVSESLTGVPWHSDMPDLPGELAWVRVLAEPGLRVAFYAGAILLLVLLGIGARKLWKQSRPLGLVVLSLPLAGLFSALHFKYLLQVELLSWYLFYIVLGISLCLPAALCLPGGGNAWCRWLLRAGAAAWAIAAVMMQQGHMHESNEYLREAWQASRGRHEPLGYTGPSRVVTNYFVRHSFAYDGRSDTQVRSTEALRSGMDKSRAEDGEYYYIVGNPPFVRTELPEMMQIIEDPREFELVRDLPAQEVYHSLRVYRMRKSSPP